MHLLRHKHAIVLVYWIVILSYKSPIKDNIVVKLADYQDYLLANTQ